MSDSLQTHESQHARPPCPSPTHGVHSNSCSLSRWCHPAISSSVVSFSCFPQSLPASGSFPMSQLFTWGGQSIGVSASASVLPMNTQDWSPLGWTGWISSLSKGLSNVFSNATVQKHQFFGAQLSSQLSYFNTSEIRMYLKNFCLLLPLAAFLFHRAEQSSSKAELLTTLPNPFSSSAHPGSLSCSSLLHTQSWGSLDWKLKSLELDEPTARKSGFSWASYPVLIFISYVHKS